MKRQIVINVPESILETIQADKMINNVQLVALQICIRNGILLPIGHGRLKDVDDLDTTTIETDDYDGNEILEVVLREDIDDAPTIIPADTESEEEE